MNPQLKCRIKRWVVPTIFFDSWWASFAEFVGFTSDQKTTLKELTEGRNIKFSFVLIAPILIMLTKFFVPDTTVYGLVEIHQIIYYVLIVIGLGALVLVRRFSVQYNVIHEYMVLVRRAEENKKEANWHLFQTRRWMNFGLRRLARFIARLPVALGTSHPDVALAAARRAANVRNLQKAVSGTGHHSDVYDALVYGLRHVIDRDWESLPEDDPDPTVRLTGLRRTGYIILATALAAGAVAFILFGKSFGESAQIYTQLYHCSGCRCLSGVGESRLHPR
jgi:hypothetical protein